jgi:hypothetical protein
VSTRPGQFHLIPGAILLTDAGDAVGRLRAEFVRRGYSGMTVEWPDFFWRAVGFGVLVLGVSVFISGIAT